MKFYLLLVLKIGGISQIAIALGSLILPRVMGWKQGLGNVEPLLRQMFWVYAAYIFCTNIWLGLVSLFCTEELIDKSPIGMFVAIYAALYWVARVILQFFYFDRSSFPDGRIYRIGEYLLDATFIFLSMIYIFIVFRYMTI